MLKARKEGVKSSDVFLVVGTVSYFKDIPKQEVMLAKGLNKPFRVILSRPAKKLVPRWFKAGVGDYKEKFVDDIKKFTESFDVGEMKEFLGVES